MCNSVSERHKKKHTVCSTVFLYRVSKEECARLREGVPYIKVYRYNPKHLCPKLNGYGDNDLLVGTSQLTALSMLRR